jgi:hypothetical protein
MEIVILLERPGTAVRLLNDNGFLQTTISHGTRADEFP